MYSGHEGEQSHKMQNIYENSLKQEYKAIMAHNMFDTCIGDHQTICIHADLRSTRGHCKQATSHRSVCWVDS
jgi:hypothetical protein